ncbi:dihydrofolate reductase [Klebsiella quasipneumoniae subsp. similipneumoniae]|nr:dihydrofolate reductase [Klebsiella quasipneumoniae subsp. similipneumoniae]OVU08789.1 dihydrofolate reductase [Klebsiella quasipneumoniae subsp. similipneumoniae]OVV07704.1 dihydrofolate reductase [Klebsiella quasipneumoniae subsp. similipneumoniae]OVV84031.1 dihydrofolate reductase [Klebsiella quasipneumoniae subsp. similipneumoniae]OVW02062.1 dihydrofolate reductase [Klebsiella quasipneumoniae subsp. similipneumoniae]
MAAHGVNVGLPANQKIFLFFTLRPVDEVVRFPYSGDNFLYSGMNE